jgi:hypothetical protein
LVKPQQQQEMPNPLRAMYEDLAPLLLRSPPSKRYPQQPTGMKDWDILTDPISELVYQSAVPDPVIGGTLQRTMRPTVEGKEGLATHLNILVDCSGSMGDSMFYGVSPTGFPFAGYHIAQICTAMMIAQAELAKDTFAVWGFNRGSQVVWDGPSGEHNRAIDYFLDLVPENKSPFTPTGGTSLYVGLNKVAEDLKGFVFDQSVTVCIMDAAWDDYDAVKKELFNPDMAYNDKDLRAQGPVFYVILGSPYDMKEMENTRDIMRQVLSDEYKKNMEGCVLDFALTIGEDGNMKDFGGSLVEMAQVNAGLNTTLQPCPRI